MANSKSIILDTLKFEGGHVIDPDDNGGETYKGIARKFWPKWEGWKIIDAAKKLAGFPGNIKGNAELDNMVVDFYMLNFFFRISGDLINDNKIAGTIFDSAVNEGVIPAVKRAQRILHIPETGKITPEFSKLLNLLI